MVPRGDGDCGIQGGWSGLGTWPNGPPARSAPPQSAHASRKSAISRGQPSAGSKSDPYPRPRACLATEGATGRRGRNGARGALRTRLAENPKAPHFGPEISP
jgi:hypothetical protein